MIRRTDEICPRVKKDYSTVRHRRPPPPEPKPVILCLFVHARKRFESSSLSLLQERMAATKCEQQQLSVGAPGLAVDALLPCCPAALSFRSDDQCGEFPPIPPCILLTGAAPLFSSSQAHKCRDRSRQRAPSYGNNKIPVSSPSTGHALFAAAAATTTTTTKNALPWAPIGWKQSTLRDPLMRA